MANINTYASVTQLPIGQIPIGAVENEILYQELLDIHNSLELLLTLINQEKTDVATISSGVTTNATTSTLVAAANTNRQAAFITNSNATDEVWIKLQAASVDDDKKGRLLTAKESWDITKLNYTGEISAIAAAGAPVVHITEI